VNKKKLPEITELSNGHVRGPGSLKTFDTTDTDADMSCLDHRNIVGAVANGQK
jgi:hypothetical protein